jgi:hypothetical protein
VTVPERALVRAGEKGTRYWADMICVRPIEAAAAPATVNGEACPHCH